MYQNYYLLISSTTIGIGCFENIVEIIVLVLSEDFQKSSLK